jgi:hypothetical protein
MAWERLSEIIEAGIVGAVTSFLLSLGLGYIAFKKSFPFFCFCSLLIFVTFVSIHIAKSIHKYFYGSYFGPDEQILNRAVIVSSLLGTIFSVIVQFCYLLATAFGSWR